MSGASAENPVRIAYIGAGPAALMNLERLLARHRRDRPGLPLDIRLIDPYEPGGGRIWRREQSPLLKLNSMLRDVAVFTDESCRIDGPIEPGPALDEWVRMVRDGEAARPDWSDETLERELAGIEADGFPTRRLNNAYLGWAYGEVLRRAESSAAVAWHAALVVDIDEAQGSEPHRLRLSDGTVLEADIVVHMLGHNGSDPSGESVGLADFARGHGLDYVAPAFTADLDFSWLRAGQKVIVRGMGLAAVDLVVMLTEGRGGKFVRADDREASGPLRYLPSGDEPELHLGSRRGVPYRSKITSELVGEPVELEYLGPDFLARAGASVDGSIDFERDVWPLLAAELLTGYYRELFTGHPRLVTVSWGEFAPLLREILEQPSGYRGEALRRLIEGAVTDPSDRFDLDAFDRPLERRDGGEYDGGARLAHHSVQEAVQRHIALDLRLRTSQRHSATQGLFFAALLAYFSLAEVPTAKWNARSLTRELPKRWHSYFSYLASGPPGHRLEEFLALADAGVLHFLGGNLRLIADDERGLFRAEGSADAASGSVRAGVEARALIDAWLPDASAARSDNPLLRRLVESGQAREVATADAHHSGSTGQLVVTPEGRLPDVRRQFALGPFTSGQTGGAFTRPGMNSLAFRRHDALAGELLGEAARLSERPAPAGERPPVIAPAPSGAR